MVPEYKGTDRCGRYSDNLRKHCAARDTVHTLSLCFPEPNNSAIVPVVVACSNMEILPRRVVEAVPEDGLTVEHIRLVRDTFELGRLVPMRAPDLLLHVRSSNHPVPVLGGAEDSPCPISEVALLVTLVETGGAGMRARLDVIICWLGGDQGGAEFAPCHTRSIVNFTRARAWVAA